MAWEWSHSDDAYGYAEEQLGKLKRATLIEIAEEWRTKLSAKGKPPFDSEHMRSMSEECLVNWIWEQASSWDHGRTCSNGGHELYLCPHGCHTVDLRDMPEDWSPSDY